MKERFQEQDGWCGPATLQYILAKEGVCSTQIELAQMMGTTQEEGTSHDEMVRCARKLGFKATPIRGLDIEELGRFTTNHHVIVNWMDGENEEDDGHYSNLIGVSDGRVVLRDRVIMKEEFIKKWYDIEDGIKIEKWAMIISKNG